MSRVTGENEKGGGEREVRGGGEERERGSQARGADVSLDNHPVADGHECEYA